MIKKYQFNQNQSKLTGHFKSSSNSINSNQIVGEKTFTYLSKNLRTDSSP